MKKQIVPTHVRTQVRVSPGKGRGVFAIKAIKKGEIIEISPALYIPPSDSPFIGSTVLSCYTFAEEGGEGEWLALGHASMYNHSEEPSADWAIGNGVAIVRAKRNIQAGEEITFNYGWDEDFLDEQGIK